MNSFLSSQSQDSIFFFKCIGYMGMCAINGKNCNVLSYGTVGIGGIFFMM